MEEIADEERAAENAAKLRKQNPSQSSVGGSDVMFDDENNNYDNLVSKLLTLSHFELFC